MQNLASSSSQQEGAGTKAVLGEAGVDENEDVEQELVCSFRKTYPSISTTPF